MHTQPMEDIDAVIGRFQTWAGSRKPAQPGIRELTYEEALESRRNRWRGNEKRNREKESGEQPGAARPVAAPAAAKAERHSKSKAEKGHSAKQRMSAKPRTPSYALKSSRLASAAPSPAKKNAVQSETNPASEPSAFREVLARAVQPAEVAFESHPAELGRQVAISIRLAPSERALLRTRAAEAGITVSAYIRQCALEVEQLREHVRQTLAVIDQQTPVPDATPEQRPIPPPGFLTRLMRRLLPTSTPRLALRA